MKTSELAGALLDYWVAKAGGVGGRIVTDADNTGCVLPKGGEFRRPGYQGGNIVDNWEPWSPSQSWEDGGRIIELKHICIEWEDAKQCWHAQLEHAAREDGVQLSFALGKTPLIAAMRAYVASKFGEEVPE